MGGGGGTKFGNMGYFDVPCNFVVYQRRREKFGRLGYFDVYFSKNYLFLKLKASMTSL